jgi:hypothetical protein
VEAVHPIAGDTFGLDPKSLTWPNLLLVLKANAATAVTMNAAELRMILLLFINVGAFCCKKQNFRLMKITYSVKGFRFALTPSYATTGVDRIDVDEEHHCHWVCTLDQCVADISCARGFSIC